MENEITIIPLCIKRRMTLIENNWGDCNWGQYLSLTYTKELYIRDMCESLYYMYIHLEPHKTPHFETCVDALVLLYGKRLGEVWEQRHHYMTRLLL